MSSRIKDLHEEVLSRAWYTLRRYTYKWKTFRGPWQEQKREVFDRGNGVAVLMRNSLTNKIMLVSQFRLPTWLNGNPEGLLLEVPAGVLDSDNPELCMIREIEEETGYRINRVERIFEAYTSPGAVTEKLYFFYCDYARAEKVNNGGGRIDETEDLLLKEYSPEEVRNLIANGSIKDAKTLLLLQYGMLQGWI